MNTEEKRQRAEFILNDMKEREFRRDEEWHNWVQHSLADKEDTDRKLDRVSNMLCQLHRDANTEKPEVPMTPPEFR